MALCLGGGARAAAPVDYDVPDPDRSARHYARAAANLAFTNYAIWQVAWSRNKDWAPVTRDSLLENLRAGFEFDQDVLQTNFFGHPYHGGLQFNAARGAGLSFWESAAYSLAGSLSWELFAEIERPSFNDLASTALGGIMLGEITHRLSSQLLDDGREGGARLWRELAAAAVDPLRGFDRLTTGRAFRSGPPGKRRPLRLAFEMGVDRVSLNEEEDELRPTRPALLFAADVEYGNLLPDAGRKSLRPFEFFELYAAANLFNSLLSGAHVYASGLLYGAHLPLSEEPSRDNDVFGVGMNYEYVGTNFTTYSGVGVGVVNHLMLRMGKRRAVRISVGGDFVPVLGASSTEAGDGERDYNFATGLSPWSGVRVEMGAFGELGLRMRHYVATVIDGEPGDELIGSTRLWYELEPFPGVGFGVAPTLVYRRGQYRDRPSYSAHQVSTQFYVTVNR